MSLKLFKENFKCTENKGVFPYEWFDHIEKLDSQTLPPYETFYSHLKIANSLDESMEGNMVGGIMKRFLIFGRIKM